MKFNEIYFDKSSSDVLLIQPNMLQQVKPQHIDPVQTNYWETCENVGSLFGDLPIEPNWGLLSIASNLEDNGYSVCYLDFHLFDYIKVKKLNDFINDADIKKVLSTKRYKAVGISSMTLSHFNALRIAKMCKEVNPNCAVIVGGVHFSFVPEKALESEYIDAVLCGEGELSFVKLMNHLEDKKFWCNIEGLVYKNGNSVIQNTTQLIDDLGMLPIADYKLWPSDIPLIPRIYTARGCNGGCDYCVVNRFFLNYYRKRPLEKVCEELEFVTQDLGCREILIGDLNLAASKKDTLQLCDFIIENDLNIEWWCQTRPDGLDRELLEKMDEAGCIQVGIGIESAEDNILDNSMSKKKNITFSTRELCSLIKKFGMEVQEYLIIGLPGETIETAINTINYIDCLTKNDYVDISHIAVLVPYPGTPIYQNTEHYDIKILTDDYSKYLMNCDYMNAGVPVVKTSQLINFQIYSLWQLALSTAAKNFELKRNKTRHKMFNNLDEFWKYV